MEMIKIPYDKIIEKIKEQAKISDSEIDSKIKEKSDQLAGLISKEGAAHIIANELGVKLFEEGKLKLKDILPGMRSVETIGKITNIFELREFQRKDGSNGKVASFIIADETNRTRVVLWNDQTDILKELKEGTIIQINNGFSKENNGKLEIHTASKSEIIINPEGITIENPVERAKANRKIIKDLSENDSNIELLATIVQVFEPRFYEVCPECNKRLKQKESKLACDTHGEVAPSYGFVMNAILDDGTETIRTVFFKNQLTNLLKTEEADILKFKDSPADFQGIKDSLPGTIIKVVGRTSKNEMFDRLEFITQLVFPDPNPDEELKKLQEEAKVIE
jgi:replication factor A1